jgi:hypothetical protein
MKKRVLLIGFCVRTSVAWSKPSHVAVSHEAASDSTSVRSAAFVRIESILVTVKTLLADNPRYLRVQSRSLMLRLAMSLREFSLNRPCSRMD